MECFTACRAGDLCALTKEQGAALLQLPIDNIRRVCPFPHFFWPKGRVAARSLLQILSYPMYIIPESFPLVKHGAFFYELA